MTKLVRLLDDERASDLQRSLLQSLAGQRSRVGARERVLMAMGLPVVAPLVSAPAATKGVTTSAAAIKVLAAVSLIATGSVLAVVYQYQGSEKVCNPAAPSHDQTALTTLPNAVAQNRALTVPATAAANEMLAPPVAKAAKASSRGAPSSPSGETLMDELALMDRARLSLAQGAPSDTISAVHRYQSRYPSGAFRQEAAFLRVSALHAQRDDSASAAARTFISQYPASPYAARVRAIVDDRVQAE